MVYVSSVSPSIVAPLCRAVSFTVTLIAGVADGSSSSPSPHAANRKSEPHSSTVRTSANKPNFFFIFPPSFRQDAQP